MYGTHSLTRRLISGAARVLVTLIALSLLGSILEPLLVTAAGVTVLALVIGICLRVRLFRWRGW